MDDLVSILTFVVFICISLVVIGIVLIVNKKYKSLGIALLILGFAIPLIGLSICGLLILGN